MRPVIREVKKDEEHSFMGSEAIDRIAEPRQQRAIETRAGLLAAVQRIVAADGIDAVTTTRVAAETGMAVGTIYRYFIDRDDLLLAAYDDTVAHLVDRCAMELGAIPDDVTIGDAVRQLVDIYLTAAEADPAHAALLVNMRHHRPVDSAETANEERTINDIIEPFLARFAPDAAPDRTRLRLLNTLIGTLVDIYLTTQEPAARQFLRGEIEAHARFLIGRISCQD